MPVQQVGAFVDMAVAVEDQINAMGAGLMVHDIGKGVLGKSLLNKPGKLTESEWAAMRRHPEEGVILLREAGHASEEACIIVEAHHEKLDGSGYPFGLEGDGIHRYARIAAIADIFDALTTRRPYKPAEKSFDALKIMRDEMAGGLDQELFREFVQLMGEGPARDPRHTD